MEAFRRRLGHYVEVDDGHFSDINELPHRLETKLPGTEIVSIGEKIDYVFVIEKGWAIRCRILNDGRRQILNFMLPGDCFDLMSVVQANSDHSIVAATEVVVRRIGSADFFKAIQTNASLAMAFWWMSVQEEAILREQIIRIGRRSAKERLAHQLLELNRRLAAIEGEQKDFVSLPVPQSLLADALGLSIVHVSRTISSLRRDGLIELSPQGIEIKKRQELAELADFDSKYLHLQRLKLFTSTTP